jgi:hypothetical protein
MLEGLKTKRTLGRIEADPIDSVSLNTSCETSADHQDDDVSGPSNHQASRPSSSARDRVFAISAQKRRSEFVEGLVRERTSGRLKVDAIDSVSLNTSCKTPADLRTMIFSDPAITDRLDHPAVLDTVLPPVSQPREEDMNLPRRGSWVG